MNASHRMGLLSLALGGVVLYAGCKQATFSGSSPGGKSKRGQVFTTSDSRRTGNEQDASGSGSGNGDSGSSSGTPTNDGFFNQPTGNATPSDGGTGSPGQLDPSGGGGTSSPQDLHAVSESFRLLRSANKAGATQQYGVGLLTLTATGLLRGETILSVERTGISSDVRFVACSAGTPTAAEVKDGRQLYSQTHDCFLVYRGLKKPVAMHRFYSGLTRVAKLGTVASPRVFNAANAFCVVPEGEGEPCVAKAGRVLVKPIESTKTIADFGYPFVEFPANSVIEADVRLLK
jgi:hypothetical protein